jgi:hypothetical protein
VGPKGALDSVEKREIFFLYRELNPSYLGLPARSLITDTCQGEGEGGIKNLQESRTSRQKVHGTDAGGSLAG